MNVDQEHSKISSKQQAIVEGPSLLRAAQQASSWTQVPGQNQLEREVGKESENKAEWKVLDLSKVIKT